MGIHRIQASALLGVCFLGLFASEPIKTCAQSAEPSSRNILLAVDSEVEQAIRDSAQSFVDAFNKGDAQAIAALWTKDGELVDETGFRTSGRAAIEEQYKTFFTENPGAKIEVAINSIRQISQDSAMEDGQSLLTLASSAGTMASGTYVAVHVKENGKWLMASVRESAARPLKSELNLKDLAWLIGTWAVSGDDAKFEVTYDWLGNGNFIRGETTVLSDEGKPSGGTQIIGKDPLTGRIVSWSFNADGGLGYGEWAKEGAHWLIRTQGVTADGMPTSAVNILYDADNNVHSWQSVNRTVGDQILPRTKEVVIERKSASKSAEK